MRLKPMLPSSARYVDPPRCIGFYKSEFYEGFMSNVIVKNTKKYGRRLYATRNFKKGEIVEVSPVVVIDSDDANTIWSTLLSLYTFEWGKESSALALGYGSLFNHSKTFNVSYMNSFKTKEIFFVTTKNIRSGQQLFIDYGYSPKKEMGLLKKGRN